MNLIHNRLEEIVIQKVAAEGAKWPVLNANPGLLADAVCIALNSIPPHYIRHAVDLSFYMTNQKREQENLTVNAAVEAAIERVLYDKEVQQKS